MASLERSCVVDGLEPYRSTGATEPDLLARVRSMDGLGAVRTPRRYAEDDVGMPFGAVLDPVLSRLAKALAELRRLKAVRHENDLRATATLSFGLGCLKACLAQTPAAKTRVDPEVRDLAATAPAMSAKATHHLPCVALNASAQEPTIRISGRFRSELVNAVRQERIQLLAESLVKQCSSVASQGS